MPPNTGISNLILSDVMLVDIEICVEGGQGVGVAAGAEERCVRGVYVWG